MESLAYKSQTVSAVLVTHNNQRSIDKCLESLRWTDEIIIVDKGSTDGTLELARRFSDKIYFHPSSNTNTLKNYALQWVTGDWVLIIEPHEWVEDLLRHEIDSLLLNPSPETTGYTVPIKLYFQGQWLAHGGFYPRREARLFRRGSGTVTMGGDGEEVLIEGNVHKLERALGCAPYEDLSELYADVNHRSTQAAYGAIEAGEAEGNQTLIRILWAANKEFLKRYFLGRGFQDGVGGLSFLMAEVVQIFLKNAKLQTMKS